MHRNIPGLPSVVHKPMAPGPMILILWCHADLRTTDRGAVVDIGIFGAGIRAAEWIRRRSAWSSCDLGTIRSFDRYTARGDEVPSLFLESLWCFRRRLQCKLWCE